MQPTDLRKSQSESSKDRHGWSRVTWSRGKSDDSKGDSTRHSIGLHTTQQTVSQGTDCSLTVARRTRDELEDVGDDIKLNSGKTCSSRTWVRGDRPADLSWTVHCTPRTQWSCTLFLTPDGVTLRHARDSTGGNSATGKRFFCRCARDYVASFGRTSPACRSQRLQAEDVGVGVAPNVAMSAPPQEGAKDVRHAT